MSARTIFKLKNFSTASRIRLPVNQPIQQSSRSLALSSTNYSFNLINKESQIPQDNSSSTFDRPTVYSDGEVETAGPVVRL
ncbi:hypothetical protein BN7_5299 [Wickerhamomyces ciferrii]|uniref:Uncharacterized protein n=1 Tax=Wickerhamomyces ciferrii (strain ATCC 14091 / BCRC 22168 / CBS 111 / JCM 3599 / NBRC 0793 / NRRL Y-1031 F-60-10) TaxID=1206466 RepID=K0KW35_WICCF|nr:uncharacterized protein BN7_5299 [Wickerhamomyces ciferrii]CCH45714.1 hypothetical protein BN7_5299 [Wickerhamomyces ciferrii]